MTNNLQETEGIIKFKAVHTTGPAPDHDQLDELNSLRDKLFELKLIGSTTASLGYGNVSIRTKNGFIISATGTGCKPNLEHDDYCLVQHCNIAENTLHSYGPKQASSESLTHFAIYSSKPKVNCVVHIHNKERFEMLLQQACSSTPKNIAYGTIAMAYAVQDCVCDLTDCDICVMGGHEDGILIFATQVREIMGML